RAAFRRVSEREKGGAVTAPPPASPAAILEPAVAEIGNSPSGMLGVLYARGIAERRVRKAAIRRLVSVRLDVAAQMLFAIGSQRRRQRRRDDPNRCRNDEKAFHA